MAFPNSTRGRSKQAAHTQQHSLSASLFQSGTNLDQDSKPKLLQLTKRIQPAAANANSSAIVPVTAGPSQSAKPPKGPTSRCEACATCLNKAGKKGCLRNKAQKDTLAAAQSTTLTFSAKVDRLRTL
ncbi:TPA: hypothetical protein ACH3X1_013211 [Trebouxia sp. C0004]